MLVQGGPKSKLPGAREDLNPTLIVWEIFRTHQYQCFFVCCLHCLFSTLVALNGLG
jgi:hypothetical protein